MGTVLQANLPQTLYVNVRRDELRELKEERDQLQLQVAQLTMVLQSHGLMLAGPTRVRLA